METITPTNYKLRVTIRLTRVNVDQTTVKIGSNENLMHSIKTHILFKVTHSIFLFCLNQC